MNKRFLLAQGFAVLFLSLGSVAFYSQPALALSARPSAEMPAFIDESIPDGAELISCDYAVLPDGAVVFVANGSAAPADLFGDDVTPPDPLDVSGGKRFERMSVGEARRQMRDGGAVAFVRSLDNGSYGAYWGSYNGEQAFFDSKGQMFACKAKGVIDVSEHNGIIDWENAKADGVEGAIIRIGFGYSRIDYKAQRNINECKRLGIPFGVYLYTYAEGVDDARLEGDFIVKSLKTLGVSAADLSYPIYYDMEEWRWSGHSPVTNPAVNASMVEACVKQIKAAGYDNVAVYSYTSWLNTALKSPYIHQLTNWVAQYNGRLTYNDLTSNYRGWQYTSDGVVAGINGKCDLNAFGYKTWPESCVAGYSDVWESTPHAEDIEWVTTAGIAEGWKNQNGTRSFRPYAQVARCDMAAFLYRLAGSPSYEPSDEDMSAFSDVDADTPHFKEICWLASSGISTGWVSLDGESEFRPNAPVARQDMAAFLRRTSSYLGHDVSVSSSAPFKDVVEGDDVNHADDVAWLASTGVSKGFGDGTFRGLDSVKRCDMAAFMKRMSDANLV